MKHIQIKDYVGSLLKNPEPDLGEVQNTINLYSVYIAGLQGKDFPIDNLVKEFDIEKEIPPQFHTTVLQSAILKSKQAQAEVRDYLFKRIDETVKDIKNYFKI